MRKFNGYDETQRNTGSKFIGQLPAGGYVCKIKDASVQQFGNGEKLVFSFDVAEGDYKDFFTTKFSECTFDDKKYKGMFSLWLPTDDGSERDERTKRIFKSFICDVEDSNEGFTWDWDETALNGKTVGMLFNEAEYNGHKFTKAYGSVTADKVREGRFRIWQPEIKTTDSKSADNSFDFMPF